MTSRLGIFTVICRKSLMLRQTRCTLKYVNALFHRSSFNFNETIEIKMPSLSPTMTEGTIVKWLKKEGDTISPGDVLCEIQTDKAIVGLEVEEEGVLIKILMPEDSKNVKLGEIIAVIGSEGSTYEVSDKKRVVSEDLTEKKEMTQVLDKKHVEKDIPKLLGPSVRKLLEEYNISFTQVSSSGSHHNILKSDVLKYIQSNNLKQRAPEAKEIKLPEIPLSPVTLSTSSNFIDIPLTSMRKTIAKRLSESKSTIPHAYINIDCNLDKILSLRKMFKADGINVSVNDFIIKSSASALNKCPKINVINSNGRPVSVPSIDISVAVATENGLITPIVKNANHLSVQEISSTVKSLALKAKDGKLKVEEFQGGSFTISNLGMFGISEFCAVINPPQGAILAVGKTRLVAGENIPVQKINLTMSFDCSIISEEDAGDFLQILRNILENPSSILL